MTKRVQATVSGRVQGIGYRYYASHVAGEMGVTGTVRNLPGGEVEAVAEAEEATLHEFLKALRHGPHAAEVTALAVAWSEPTGEFTAFAAIA